MHPISISTLRPFVVGLLGLALIAFASACSTREGAQEGGLGAARGMMAQAEMAPGAPADRQIIRSADLEIEVADVEAGRSAAETAVAGRGGHVQSVRETKESLYLQLRVPVDQLDAFLADLSGLGEVTRSSVSSTDVTEQHADLTVRLANARKLRDRLQQLLDKATTVEEMLAVEKELSRVQSQVESLQGRLDRLDGQISMSSVGLTLKPGRILGPLGYVGYGIWWVIEKLFVIR